LLCNIAGWFVWNKIHSLERRSLSEFFDQKAVSKTPKIYKEYRDFIINKYRENPHRPLKFTEVRRMLIGDVNSLRRVFDFLEHWGLINHQVLQDSETKAAGAASPVPVPMVVDSLPSGIRVVPSPVPSPSKTQSSVVLDASDGSVGALRSNSLATHKSVYTSASRHSVSDDASGASNKPEAEILCHICKGECSKQRFYHRRVGISLCVGCFKNGKLPVGTTVGEFIRIEAGVRAPTKEWSSKENLLLLEALLSYGDNWNQVGCENLVLLILNRRLVVVNKYLTL
jgi:SWI/SNF related-matrix-associated actin-dependent regulator of chromatin subfamily C